MVLLTLAEAAARLKRPKPTVQRWCRQGLLKAHRHGRSFAIKESDLAKFVPPQRGRPKKG